MVYVFKGIKIACYQLEEDREFHLMRALAQESSVAEITRHEWVKQNPERSRKILADQQEFLENMGRSIWACPDTQQTLDQLAQWAEERAKAGYRIICIDPITAAAQTDKCWIKDSEFLQRIKRTATDKGCSGMDNSLEQTNERIVKAI